MKRSVVTCVLSALLFLVPFASWGVDLPGGVIVYEGGEIRWGQYRHLKGLIAVEYPRELEAGAPADSFVQRLSQYPSSGASSVLLRCQRPGNRFFSVDGSQIEERERKALKDQLEALNRFDMLPIVTLFDPDPSARLDSADAYSKAIVTFVEEFSKENWFLLCVCERCDPKEWKTDFAVPMVDIALEGAEWVEEFDPEIVVGAGATDKDTLAKLASGKALDVLFRNHGAFDEESTDTNMTGWKGPYIDLIPGTAATKEVCSDIAQKVGFVRLHDEFSNAYAIHLDTSTKDEKSEALTHLLSDLREAVDTFQRKSSNARPPEEGDTHSLKPGEAEEGFISLFNGRDLSGWIPHTEPGDFVVKDGVIQLEGKGGGWLRSWNSYGDYIFRGEYWIEEGGNSGFFNRAPFAGRESRIGFEFQIHGEQPDDPTGKESSGAIYYVRAPDGNFMKPGEWNEVEITCRGTEIKIVWNGHLAHRFRYEDIDFMKNRGREGYIGLQDHHNFVKFRNLRIKRLD